MLRRTILLSAVTIVALPVADAHASQHFLGHSTCGAGGTSCPRQHREFTALVRGRYLRAVALPFRCTYTDGSGTGVGFVSVPRIRVRESGRFRWVGHDIRIVGRLTRHGLAGRVTATEPASNPPYDSDCKVRGLRFSARYVEHPLHRTGIYRGSARCSSARCPAQHHPLTVRVRGNYVVDLRTTLTCRTETRATKRIHIKLSRMRMDWYGRFSAAIDRPTSTTDGTLEVYGAARGRRVTGTLSYYEESNDGSRYCQGHATFSALRRGS